MHDAITTPADADKKMTSADVRQMEESFARGDFRRVSSQSSSGDQRASG